MSTKTQVNPGATDHAEFRSHDTATEQELHFLIFFVVTQVQKHSLETSS
jgi:hypothetical protein